MRSLWGSLFVKLLRAAVFIPLGFVLLQLLYAIPVALIAWLSSTSFEPTWFNVLLALMVVTAGLGILGLYWSIIYLSTVLTCRVVAPWPKISTVIFGTLFVLAFVLNWIPLFTSNNSWWYLLLLYDIAFAWPVGLGLYVSYIEEGELSRA